jgi:hypothetical protein
MLDTKKLKVTHQQLSRANETLPEVLEREIGWLDAYVQGEMLAVFERHLKGLQQALTVIRRQFVATRKVDGEDEKYITDPEGYQDAINEIMSKTITLETPLLRASALLNRDKDDKDDDAKRTSKGRLFFGLRPFLEMDLDLPKAE